jgi:hypothetical protein
VFDGTLIAGAGSSKSCLSLARDGVGPMLPYCMPLPGVLASPDRSSAPWPVLLPCWAAVDPGRNEGGSLARPLFGPSVFRRGGVKLWLIPKKVAGVVA